MRLRDKVVIVTGAASGIGRAVSERVASEGAKLAALDVSDAVGELADFAALCYQVDVSKPPDAERAIGVIHDQFGRIDVLLHFAGIMRGQGIPVYEFPDQLWAEVIDVNLTGAYLMAKHASHFMLTAGAGVIVLAASVAGVLGPSGSIAYGASKGGVHGLSLTLAAQLGPHGIRVHAICPSAVDTPLLRRSMAEGGARDPERYEGVRAQMVPADRIADVVVFLASDEASHLLGTVFTK